MCTKCMISQKKETSFTEFYFFFLTTRYQCDPGMLFETTKTQEMTINCGSDGTWEALGTCKGKI